MDRIAHTCLQVYLFLPKTRYQEISVYDELEDYNQTCTSYENLLSSVASCCLIWHDGNYVFSFFSRDFESSGEPLGDPCKGVKCNIPYEVAVETASTVCQCQCVSGFGGPDCSEFEHGNCDYVKCIDGGVRNRDGDYCYCNCPEGWGGEFCEFQTTACPGVKCPEGTFPDPNKNVNVFKSTPKII